MNRAKTVFNKKRKTM